MPKETVGIAVTRKAILTADDQIARLDRQLKKGAERRRKIEEQKAGLERQLREQEMLLQVALLAAEKHPNFIKALYEKLTPEDRAAIDAMGFQDFYNTKILPALQPSKE